MLAAKEKNRFGFKTPSRLHVVYGACPLTAERSSRGGSRRGTGKARCNYVLPGIPDSRRRVRLAAVDRKGGMSKPTISDDLSARRAKIRMRSLAMHAGRRRA